MAGNWHKNAFLEHNRKNPVESISPPSGKAREDRQDIFKRNLIVDMREVGEGRR